MRLGRSFSRTAAVARKEALHIVRDPRSLIMALAVPLLLLLLFGYALSLDVDRIPTLVYDQDRTPESRELIRQFAGSRYFEILGYENHYEAIERRVDEGRCLLAVVIPRGYSRDLLRGRRTHVQLLLNGEDSNTASIALGYAESLAGDFNRRLRRRFGQKKGGEEFEIPVEALPRVWYNSELKSRNSIVPGLIVVITMMIASLLTSLTIAREWEAGSMEQILSTPLRPHEIVLGKMAAYFGVGLIDMLVAIVFGVLLFGVPLRGAPLLVLFTGCIFLAGALFWGILISAIARSQLLAYQMGMITSFLPAILLSGFLFPVENMPKPIQAVSYIFPSRYFITILRGIFLKGVGMEILWSEAAFLAAFALIVFFAATRRLKPKLE